MFDRKIFILFLTVYALLGCSESKENRMVLDFNDDWKFELGDEQSYSDMGYDDSSWRVLNVPHDWSIEGEFSKDHPATAGGGALPGGIGWYRKSFSIDESSKGKQVYAQFDGIYMNSEVWINGTFLGKRPFGYISFEYDLTPYLIFGKEKNVIAVRVDNSQQPNSRWYSGSGIYRNTRLIVVDPIHVVQWGTYITTPKINEEQASVRVETHIINNSGYEDSVTVCTILLDQNDLTVSTLGSEATLSSEGNTSVSQLLRITDPNLWSLDDPYLYRAVTKIEKNGKTIDEYETPFGIRDFAFDQMKGFSLNGKPTKINGVCMHHDLGCLGSAINERAIERQLEILQDMGVNAVRTAHNPPAPELLDLCDRMGILVMDETFDIWSMKKSPYDYSHYWEEWHEKDLKDHILRDRNHPSVFSWSIGNEIIDQWHDIGEETAMELAEIVRSLDDTRPVTAAMNPPNRDGNSIARSGALDLMGYNYHHHKFEAHNEQFPSTPFIATETTSALATRGYYDQRSDTIKRWPIRWDLLFTGGNPGNTVSAYDQVSAPWGSTHEETWCIMKKHDFLTGMFIWTGFDYLGEPTPYTWPSRSSYFGVVDLAGFPKDSYYMYQSEWTDQDVLHVFPHWNWSERDTVDVWAYFNAEEVELFLNGESMGTKSKIENKMHAMWRLAYQPGELTAISRTSGEVVLQRSILTSEEPKSIKLVPDKSTIEANGKDLSFITVEVLDSEGIPVPTASNNIRFTVSGEGTLVGVDNGDPTSHLSLKGQEMKIFNGKCLAVIQSKKETGVIELTASSPGLGETKITINTSL